MGPFQKEMRNNIIFQPVIFKKIMLDLLLRCVFAFGMEKNILLKFIK